MVGGGGVSHTKIEEGNKRIETEHVMEVVFQHRPTILSRC